MYNVIGVYCAVYSYISPGVPNALVYTVIHYTTSTTPLSGVDARLMHDQPPGVSLQTHCTNNQPLVAVYLPKGDGGQGRDASP